MTGNADRLTYLYTKYINGSCTVTELQEFFEYVSAPEMRETLQELADKHLQGIQPRSEVPVIDWDYMYNRIIQSEQQSIHVTGKKGIVKRLLTRPRMAAASIILVAAVGIYFLLRHQPQQDTMEARNGRFKNDIPPGSSKAVLTLANGVSIALHDKRNSALAQRENAFKLDSGELAYNTNGRIEKAMGLNKLATPRGGQFRLVLPDGSKVWLNAASSITYPGAFTENERKVAITGEVYLEVAKDANKPFKVAVNGMEITVLGTRFNVNAYRDEPLISTTLLDGAIKISKGRNSRLLQPGQQLQLLPNGAFRLMNDADTTAAVAWKDGMFSFNDADITSIMRQVNRWYDAEIVYETKVSQHFMGTIPRNVQVSKLLTMLELTGRLRFKIEGRKIIVTQP